MPKQKSDIERITDLFRELSEVYTTHAKVTGPQMRQIHLNLANEFKAAPKAAKKAAPKAAKKAAPKADPKKSADW